MGFLEPQFCIESEAAVGVFQGDSLILPPSPLSLVIPAKCFIVFLV